MVAVEQKFLRNNNTEDFTLLSIFQVRKIPIDHYIALRSRFNYSFYDV